MKAQLTPQQSKSSESRDSSSILSKRTKVEVKDLSCDYGASPAVKRVSLNIPEHAVTALIGPSGCGKSTFLRTMNRMNQLVRSARTEGSIRLNGQDIESVELTELRRRVGMVFQKAN